MTIPSTLTTADVLRLLPALEKWNTWAALQVAAEIPGAIYEALGPPGYETAVLRVTIPSEVVTRELGTKVKCRKLFRDWEGKMPATHPDNCEFCVGGGEGRPGLVDIGPRPAIVISTESA